MDRRTSASVIEAARKAAPDRQRVYERSPEFSVLLAESPIDAHFLRSMSPRARWILLTDFTEVEADPQPMTVREPSRVEWGIFSWAALKACQEVRELWSDARPVTGLAA